MNPNLTISVGLAIACVLLFWMSSLCGHPVAEQWFKPALVSPAEIIEGNTLLGSSPPPQKSQVLASLMDSSWLISALAECESGGNPDAYNEKDPHGGSYGLLQFQKSTFQTFCVEKYGLNNDIWDFEIQIECAEKMLDEGLINHWTCGEKIFDN